MKRKPKELKIVSENIRLPTGEIVDKKPEDIPGLVARCKAAAKTFETGEIHYVADEKDVS